MNLNKKKKRKNIYTDMDTLSQLSELSSKIIIDTYHNKVQHMCVDAIRPELTGVDDTATISDDSDSSDSDSNDSDSNETVTKPDSLKINNIDDQIKDHNAKDPNINESNRNKNQTCTLENDEMEYILESIVSHKKQRNKYLFEVKWKNQTQTSWETKSYLDSFVCDDVTKYLSSLNKPSKKMHKEATNDKVKNFQDDEDISVCYNQQLDCLHEAICLREESNSAYCLRGNILYNVRCAECNQIFEKLTRQNQAHMCTNIGKGCNYALCQKCFTTKLINEIQPPRRRGRITSITI